VAASALSTQGPVAVDLGCGRRPAPGAFGLDAVALPGVQIVARLDAPHLPFRGASLDRVYARNVLEHLDDLVGVMGEIARVLRSGGRCTIEVPYFAGVSAHADPTHRRAFTYTTFEHFAAPPERGWQANRHTWFGPARFVVAARRLLFGRAHRVLGIAALANRRPALYENLFVYWFPARALTVELLKVR
jgi:SAM-dependent methyltransferase